MRKLALTGAATALVLALAGVVAVSAAPRPPRPSTHKAKTLSFDVRFSPFTRSPPTTNATPTFPSPSATRSSSTTSCSPAASGSATTSAPV
jgi:hypothetical protein